MTRIRFVAFGLLAATGALVATLLLLIAADVYVHHRIERYAGVNVWGYRGPAVGKKKPNEHRLVVVGGSTAFGYGVQAEEAFPGIVRFFESLARKPRTFLELVSRYEQFDTSTRDVRAAA